MQVARITRGRPIFNFNRCSSQTLVKGLLPVMDTEIGCFMKPEVAMQRRRFSREFKVEAVGVRHKDGMVASMAEGGRSHLEGASESVAPLGREAGRKYGGRPAGQSLPGVFIARPLRVAPALSWL